MAEIRDALKYLAPLDWEDVPKDNPGDFISKCFGAAELLVNTVPPVPGGTPFHSARPHFKTPNAAKSSKDVFPSPARPCPTDVDPDLVKGWGKSMKFGKKENPLEVALYKMAGHDRHGAWYARHQVVEGIGFDKFRRALMREFPETLLEQGPPGAGAKRGLSAERRVERIDVDGVGRIEVYHLSAQMPPPVTPRDFLTLFLSTTEGLTEKSGAETQDGKKHVPRHFMVVSRPVEHPDAPPRSSFVRGKYESVELIREIPLHVSPSTSSLAVESSADDSAIDPELNPVEWIMITRSDPAGGVPRFLVDRGTPSAMLGDVTKFLDWACGTEEIPDQDADLEKQQQMSQENESETTQEESASTEISQTDGPSQRSASKSAPPAPSAVGPDQGAIASDTPAPIQSPGLMASLTDNLQAGMETYAPTSVTNFVNRQLQPTDPSDSSSDTSSTDSFTSAQEIDRMTTAPESPPRASAESLSVASATSSAELSKTDKKNLGAHDKEVLKITQQREKLDQKLAQKRQEQESKLKLSQEKEESEQAKAREKMEKEMAKTEERHRKEMEKLEARRAKELKKAEARLRKKDDSNKLSQVARERDEVREQVELLRKENGLLREQVEVLQRENTALAGRLGRIGGEGILKGVREEVGGRERAGTGSPVPSLKSV